MHQGLLAHPSDRCWRSVARPRAGGSSDQWRWSSRSLPWFTPVAKPAAAVNVKRLPGAVHAEIDETLALAESFRTHKHAGLRVPLFHHLPRGPIAFASKSAVGCCSATLLLRRRQLRLPLCGCGQRPSPTRGNEAQRKPARLVRCAAAVIGSERCHDASTSIGSSQSDPMLLISSLDESRDYSAKLTCKPFASSSRHARRRARALHKITRHL